MFDWLRRFAARARPIDSAETLGLFIAAEASFAAQKCTIEYCRARSGLNWDKLFKEKDFRTALEICRWESYAAVLGDVALIAEGKLRPHLPGPEAVPALLAALNGMVREGFAVYELPEHRPQGWDDAVAAIELRLAQAQLAAPHPPYEVAEYSAARIFELLPIHPRLRSHDRELIRSNIRFALVRCGETMNQRFRPAQIVGEVLALPGGNTSAEAPT